MNARTHTLPWIAALLLFLVPATGIEAQVTPGECAGANLEIPTRYKAAKRIVAIGDLHGDLEAARAAFRLAGAIDENDQWIGGKLVVVQLGDQLDRGGDEIEILDFLDSLEVQAEAAGGRLIAMNGNHELMNVQLDMRYVTVEGFTDFLENPPADDSLVSPQQVVDGVGARILAMRPGGEVALR
ncbi:MAG: hypothetical protein GY906_16450, partial [bacterium]|nr:hypothetical protein [bacterium]